jgi:hypothetical protein
MDDDLPRAKGDAASLLAKEFREPIDDASRSFHQTGGSPYRFG